MLQALSLGVLRVRGVRFLGSAVFNLIHRCDSPGLDLLAAAAGVGAKK